MSMKLTGNMMNEDCICECGEHYHGVIMKILLFFAKNNANIHNLINNESCGEKLQVKR